MYLKWESAERLRHDAESGNRLCDIAHRLYQKGNIRISFKNFRFKKQLYKEIFRGGIPSLARQGLASLAMVAMNRLAGGYGDAAIAAMSIVSKIMNFVGAAVIGFGQGFQPVCGFNYGAKKITDVQLRTSEHRSMYSYVRLSIDRCTATYV